MLQDQDGQSGGEGCKESKGVKGWSVPRSLHIGSAHPPGRDQGMNGHCEKPRDSNDRLGKETFGDED